MSAERPHDGNFIQCHFSWVFCKQCKSVPTAFKAAPGRWTAAQNPNSRGTSPIVHFLDVNRSSVGDSDLLYPIKTWNMQFPVNGYTPAVACSARKVQTTSKCNHCWIITYKENWSVIDMPFTSTESPWLCWWDVKIRAKLLYTSGICNSSATAHITLQRVFRR